MFSQKLFLPMMILLISVITGCNIAKNEDPPIPTSGPRVIIVTPTPSITPPPVVVQNSATPTPTLTSNGNNNNGGTNNSGNSGNSGSTARPVLSDMSFGATAGGNNVTVFPKGVKEIYLRFSYANIPVGTTMQRTWYRNGQQVASREESWSANWGTSGRLTHIRFYDEVTGLASGDYTVYVSLPAYGVQINGSFKISASEPAFDRLTFSTTATGADTTVFPYGTQEVYARWNFSGVPDGAILRREWYRNGILVVQREESWKAEWGTDGTLREIRYYDFDSGYGIEPGNYRVVMALRDLYSARVEATFTIESNVGPRFSNLRFATSPTGTVATTFPAKTQEVYAVWDYSYIPNAAQMRRVWRRDGQIIIDRTEAWDFNKYGTSGVITDVKLFDNINGLASGTYTVNVSIVGQPSVELSGTFVIQPAAQPAPLFGALSVSTLPGGQAAVSFPNGLSELYATFDFANVPAGTSLQTKLTPVAEVAVDQIRTTTWTYVETGRVTNLRVVFAESPLAPGTYRLTVSLPDKNVSTSTEFTVTP